MLQGEEMFMERAKETTGRARRATRREEEDQEERRQAGPRESVVLALYKESSMASFILNSNSQVNLFKPFKAFSMKNNLFTLLVVIMAATSAYQVAISTNNEQLFLGVYLFALSTGIFFLNIKYPLFKENK